MANFLKKMCSNVVKRSIGYQSLIEKVAWFMACEQIPGDYLEFGVYQGTSFSEAFLAFQKSYQNRINLEIGGENSGDQKQSRSKIWQDMRFFAFDSFEGLPELTKGDRGTSDFTQGMYSCSKDRFVSNLSSNGVDLAKVETVKGWFSDTCTPETQKSYDLKKASVVWIDCDLYSSTLDALNFITPLLQDGTVLIFDDWFSFRGSPFKGEQKAFHKWVDENRLVEKYVFSEYQKEDWKRISFIVSEIEQG